MALAGEAKTNLVDDHKKHDNDSGSSEVQIAIWTARIKEITGHLQTHKKDFATRRGLLKLVAKRNHMLRYLQNNDRDRYQAIIKKLGLRK